MKSAEEVAEKIYNALVFGERNIDTIKKFIEADRTELLDKIEKNIKKLNRNYPLSDRLGEEYQDKILNILDELRKKGEDEK